MQSHELGFFLTKKKKCPTSCCCLKKNQNAPRSSEHPPVRGKKVKTFRLDHRLQIQVVSRIQRIGCQPEKKLLYTMANPARGLLNREKRIRGQKKKSGSIPPPNPRHCSFVEKFKKMKTTRCIYLQALRRSRSVSRPYKDIFGSSTRH